MHLDPTGAWHPAVWELRSDGSGSHPLLPSLDRDVGHVAWARDGTLFVSYRDHGASVVARITSNQNAIKVASLAGVPDFSLVDSGSVDFVVGSPDRPSAAAVSDRCGRRALTHLDDGLLRMRTLGTFASFDTTSAYDGEEVPGFIITPPITSWGIVIRRSSGSMAAHTATTALSGTPLSSRSPPPATWCSIRTLAAPGRTGLRIPTSCRSLLQVMTMTTL